MADLGIVLPARKGSLSDVGSYARMAEEHGFSGVFATEAIIDSLSVAIQAAMATQRVTIGTAITNIYYRHPSLLGSSASHINEVSGGRMLLGLGTSHRVINSPRGIDMTRPLTTMRSYVEEVKQSLWGDPPPKLFLGALRAGMTRLAGEVSDGVILNMIPRRRLPDAIEAFREGVANCTHRSDGGTVGLFLGACISDNVDEARADARAAIASYCRMEFYQNLMADYGYGSEASVVNEVWQSGDHERACAAVTDDMVDQLFLCGPAGPCRDRLQEYLRVGIDLVIISSRGGSDDGRLEFEAAVQALAPGA